MHRAGIPRRVRFQIWGSVGLFLAIGSLGLAQDKQVKEQAIEHREPLSGALMFKEYCAVCHGKGGKGDGPATSALKQAPPDLTTLAMRHGGEFPDHYVEDVLRNGVKTPAHGDAEMPVWGPLFRSMNPDELFMFIRISSVMSYIKSLQVKQPGASLKSHPVAAGSNAQK
jgi:mono/diheme cytochrome c family protein